jgi:hypothetical protein
LVTAYIEEFYRVPVNADSRTGRDGARRAGDQEIAAGSA